MKFTEYPTRKDRLERKNGTELEGQPTSGAPGGGTWVLTAEDKRFHLVRTRFGVSMSLAEETQ